MFDGGLIWGVSWIWYLVGILGVGGTIAFFVLDAALATSVFQAGIRFLWSTRPGWAIVAGATMFFIADVHRSREDEANFAAKTAAFEQAQKDRDARIAKETREAVTKEIADQKTADAATDKDVKEFEDAHPPVPAIGNPFRVGADVDRLRSIAGQSVGKSGGAKGVSAARAKAAAALHKRGFGLSRSGSGGAGTTPQGQ